MSQADEAYDKHEKEEQALAEQLVADKVPMLEIMKLALRLEADGQRLASVIIEHPLYEKYRELSVIKTARGDISVALVKPTQGAVFLRGDA